MPRRPKKRGPGRPVLGDAALAVKLQVRVTEREASTIRERAESAGLSVSEYGRERMLTSGPTARPH